MSDRLEEVTGVDTKACKADLVTECSSGENVEMDGDAFRETNCMSGHLDEDHEASNKSGDATEVVGVGEGDHISSSLPETKGTIQNGTDEEFTNSTTTVNSCELEKGNEVKCGGKEGMVSSDLCGVGEKSDVKSEELVDSSPCPTRKEELYENEPDLTSAVLDENKPCASTVESELFESTAEPTSMSESDGNRQPAHEETGGKMCHSKYEEETYESKPQPTTESEMSKPYPSNEENLDDNTLCTTNERPDDQKPYPQDGELESMLHPTSESEISELTSVNMEVSGENMLCPTNDSKQHSINDNTSVPHPQNDDLSQPHPPNGDDSKSHPLNLKTCGDGSETVEQSTTDVSELATELSQTSDKFSTNEPAVNSSTTELAANSSATEPAASTSVTKPAESSLTTEPAASSSTSELAVNSSATEPVASSSMTEPAASSSTTELTASSSATEPAASSSMTEPAASSSTTELAANSSATEPAASSSMTKPAASSSTVEPASTTEPAAKPSKRLTRAEKAAQEALAAFGGSDFSSLSVRRVDLQEQLKKEAEIRKKNEKREETAPTSSTIRPQKRLQKAQTEVQQEFKDIALGEGLKKYPKVALAKQKALLKKVEGESPNPAVRYQTRLQKSKTYAKEAFGGASLDKLPLKSGRTLQSVHVTKAPGSVPVQNKTTAAPKRTLSRADKAKLESIQAFGGASLDKVMGSTRKRVARHFDDYPAKKKVKVTRRSEGTSDADGEEVTDEKENSDVEAAAV